MKTQTRRHAFTLIELLVVITIIALLCSLLMAAVFRALTVVKDVQNRNEISQLESAIASFKSTMKVDYIPSYFDPADAQSQFYFTQLFPQADMSTLTLPGPLQGHQCLVFFLGGVKDGTNTCYGFSSNPKNPLAPYVLGSGEVRKGPFFDFRPNRMGGDGGYRDVYGTKSFAYFSTSGSPGSYGNHCGDLGVTPYTDASGAFVRPNSFQIISAGVNMRFGPGGPFPTTNPDGRDDMANFSSNKLAYPN